MKTSIFTEEQIVQSLREAEIGEQSTSSVCRPHGIADQCWASCFVGHWYTDV